MIVIFVLSKDASKLDGWENKKAGFQTFKHFCFDLISSSSKIYSKKLQSSIIKGILCLTYSKTTKYLSPGKLFFPLRTGQDLKGREVANDGHYSCTNMAPLDKVKRYNAF